MSLSDLGVLTLGPPEARWRSGDPRDELLREAQLVQSLVARGVRVLAGACVYAEEDRLGATAALRRTHVHLLAEHGVAGCVLRLTPGTRGGDVAELVRYLERELKAPPRLILLAHPDEFPTVTSAVLAATNILRRGAVPHQLVLGGSTDPLVLESISRSTQHFVERRRRRPQVVDLIERMKRSRALLFSRNHARETGISLDADSLLHALGWNILSLDPGLIERRIAVLQVGAEAPAEFPDPRLRRAIARAETSQVRPEVPTLLRYYALTDLVDEHEGHVLVLDRNDDPRTGLLTSRLNGVWGPEGHRKDPLPTVTNDDGENGIMAFVASQLSGAPILHGPIDSVGETEVTLRADGAENGFVEGSPVTLLALTRFRQRYRFHAREAVAGAAPIAGNGRILVVRIENDRLGFSRTWPGPNAVLAQGHIGAAVAELAHTLTLGYHVRTHDGLDDDRDL